MQNLSPSFIFNVYACFFMVSCSHKKNALDFLDKLCSFYEQNYFFASPTAAENTQAFLDKVYELAEANGLPSKAFKSALPEFSIDQLKKHVNKVYDFPF
jgi:UDP-glucose:glycoprotein glucosyltransferase